VNSARGIMEGVIMGLAGLAAETGGAQGAAAGAEEREGKTLHGRDVMACRIVA